MDWVEVYTTNAEYEALLVQGMLENEEIDSIIMNNQNSMYMIGEFKVMVSSNDVLKAKQLIQKNTE